MGKFGQNSPFIRWSSLREEGTMTFMEHEFEILEKEFGAMPDGYCVTRVLRNENEEPVDWQFSM